MKYGTYLRERGTWAAFFLWLLFSMETFMLTIRGSLWLAIYIAVSLVVAYFGGTWVDYRHQKKYFESLQETVDQLDKKYLLPEMMPVCRRQEEKLLEQVVYQAGKSMNEQVADNRRKAKDYKEYIELWIHEVKVPIAAAKMILLNHPTEKGEMLLKEIERVEGYTEQALFYARSSSVEKDYLIRQLALRDSVEEVILQKKKSLIAVKAEIEAEELDCTVYSDSKWLNFILCQILDNSIKYVGESPLKLRIWAEEERTKVLLHVQDNGIGIPAGETGCVFEKGFTGSNGRKYQKSTGIGLYLCDKLCGRLGHGISLQSGEREGCRVTLVFPKSDHVSVAVGK